MPPACLPAPLTGGSLQAATPPIFSAGPEDPGANGNAFDLAWLHQWEVRLATLSEDCAAYSACCNVGSLGSCSVTIAIGAPF